jgi:hypothetical protein
MNPRVSGAVPVCLLLFASDALAQDAVDLAARLIGRPYVWGAEGPKAFDCSGLTQYVHQQIGIDLPRRAIQQSRVGDATGTRLQRGDLLFFATSPGQSTVTHVGLYEGGGVMIDASQRHGRVRRDDLSDRFWVERFLFARRVGPRAAPDHSGRRRIDDREVMREPASKRRATARILKGVAEILLDPRRRR